MPRTGSTLLRLILDTHPEVFAPDEIRLGRLCASLFTALEGVSESGGQDAARHEDLSASPEALAETREVVAGLMTRPTERKGKRLWCEKSPENLRYLQIIEQVFPDACYILLHRHCLDVVKSCLSASPYGFNLTVVSRYVAASTDNFVAALVRAWVEEVGKLLDFAERREQTQDGRKQGKLCFQLRYEDLVTAPEATMSALCDFLDIEMESKILERVFSSPHHQRLRAGDGNALFSSGISRGSLGRGHEIPWAEIQGLPGTLLADMNTLLERLGYPLVEGPDWSLGFDGEELPAPEEHPAPAEDREYFVRQLFEEILPKRLADMSSPALLGSSYHFLVSGEGGGSWVLDLAREPARVLPGEQQASCEIRLSSQELEAVSLGRSNPAVAHREGRVQVTGTLEVEAMRALASLLNTSEYIK